MRTMFLLIGFICAGCTTISDRITHEQMTSRLSYQGFSIAKPVSPRWFILKGEEHPTDVTLRWDLHSPTHTFYARVALGDLTRQPESHQEFAGLARSEQQAPGEVRELTRGEGLVTVQGQWCIRTDSVDAVRPSPAGPELRLVVRGYRCLHPAWPQRTLDYFYFERGLASELSPILTREGEKFLEGVRIDAALDPPAGNG